MVEVKTTRRPGDVTHFIDKLAQLKTWMPRYAANKVYGSMAYLTMDSDAGGMAARHGLLTIRATEDSAAIVNTDGFIPKTW